MKQYEIMYIIRPDVEEEAKTALINRFSGILTDNGAEITETKDWGKRRFAFEINDLRDGFYQIVKVNAKPVAVQEFSRLAKINDDIVRHLVVKLED